MSTRRAAARQRRRDPVEQPRGPDVRPQVELLAEREEQAPERHVVGDGRVGRRRRAARRRGARTTSSASGGIIAPCRWQWSVPQSSSGPLDREPERVDDLARLGDDLGADAVAGEDRDAMGRHGRILRGGRRPGRGPATRNPRRGRLAR